MKKYTVGYWEHTHIEMEVDADSPQEAENKIRDKVFSGDYDMSFAELDDSGFYVAKDDEETENKGE